MNPIERNIMKESQMTAAQIGIVFSIACLASAVATGLAYRYLEKKVK